ncbi:MAG TPA: hypothetical protein VF627_02560, partial [Abditibacterium sp.]
MKSPPIHSNRRAFFILKRHPWQPMMRSAIADDGARASLLASFSTRFKSKITISFGNNASKDARAPSSAMADLIIGCQGCRFKSPASSATAHPNEFDPPGTA